MQTLAEEFESHVWVGSRKIQGNCMRYLKLNREVKVIIRVNEGYLEKVKTVLKRVGLTWEDPFLVAVGFKLFSLTGSRRAYRRLKRYRVPGIAYCVRDGPAMIV